MTLPAALAATVSATALPVAGGSDQRLTLMADARERGYIRLRLRAPPKLPVWIGEARRRAHRRANHDREGFVRQSFPAVNTALRRTAAKLRRDVRIVDLVKVFSPGGRYRKWTRVGDRKVGVRQSDGVHLSDEGAAIAANVVIRTLRGERILTR